MAQTMLNAGEQVASQFAHDTPLRARYLQEVKQYSEHVLRLFEQGQITEGEAAYMASTVRNQLLSATRKELSPMGKVLSSYLKKEGVALPALVERYALKLFGKEAAKLTDAERAAVALRIAQKSGATNEAVNVGSRIAPKMGKALMAVAIAVAIYQVATSEDPIREAVLQGAGFAGFWLGAKVGAAAGTFVCGPPCGVVGGLAGGIVGAIVAEEAADRAYSTIKG
jgi:hypothetical protein